MPKEKKRGDNVASSRSRGATDENDKNKKTGQQAQDDFTNMIKNMFNVIDAQLNIEPRGIRINADTINNIINKKDKKKLN